MVALATVTIFVLIEKLPPFGERTRWLSAAGLMAAAVRVLLRTTIESLR